MNDLVFKSFCGPVSWNAVQIISKSLESVCQIAVNRSGRIRLFSASTITWLEFGIGITVPSSPHGRVTAIFPPRGESIFSMLDTSFNGRNGCIASFASSIVISSLALEGESPGVARTIAFHSCGASFRSGLSRSPGANRIRNAHAQPGECILLG